MKQLERSAIKEKVIEIIMENTDLEKSKIKEESQFNTDIILDSLSFAEMLMECEEQFDLEIPMEDANNFKAVKNIIDYLYEKQGKENGS